MLQQDLHKYLSKTAVFSSFPLSLLLLGLEKLIELEFVCPCGQSVFLSLHLHWTFSFYLCLNVHPIKTFKTWMQSLLCC